MRKNMGTPDKSVRILTALVIVALYLMNVIGGTLAIVLLIIAGIFILTSAFGTCPLYLPFGFSSRGKQE